MRRIALQPPFIKKQNTTIKNNAFLILDLKMFSLPQPKAFWNSQTLFLEKSF